MSFVWMPLLFVPLVEVPVSVVTLVSGLPRSISFLAHPVNKAAAASKQIIFFISRIVPFRLANTIAYPPAASMGAITNLSI